MDDNELFAEADRLSGIVIGLAIEVHRTLGPGLSEEIYEGALCIELDMAGIPYRRQAFYPVDYKGRRLSNYRIDLMVGDALLVELKSTDKIHPLFEAKVLTCLRVTRKPLGLLINFNSLFLKNGIRRLILTV